MKLPASVRRTVRTLLGPEVIRYVRHIGIAKVRKVTAFQQPFVGRRALEIGGPSDIFDYDGSLPIYPVLGSLDNCLFSAETIWAGRVGERFYYNAGKRCGTQFIAEATNLSVIGDGTYECMLASHCLEHIANPLKSLKEFQRVLVPGGTLLAVLPHKDKTFDWQRPLTPLIHIQEDFANDIKEDDATHIPEVLALHDLKKDGFLGTKEQFRERCLQNHSFRIVHHHTFNTESAIALIETAGFRVLRFETVKPYHIVILARQQSTAEA